jgi:hypothetical protein
VTQNSSTAALILTNASNAYTSLTAIVTGTLALSGSGSIASSAGVANNGIFDISAITSPGTSVKTLSGTVTTSTTALGAKALTITNALGQNLSGNITGEGGSIVLSSGTQVFSGKDSTYDVQLFNTYCKGREFNHPFVIIKNLFNNRSILERYFSGSGSPVISASKIEGVF